MALHAEDKPTPGACEIYRVIQPYHYLGKAKGWTANWDNMRTLFAEWYLAAANGKAAEAIHRTLSNLDIMVLPRARVDEVKASEFIDGFFDALRAYDVKVVYEVDDDFTNVHRQVIEQSMSAFASRCDAITVTTPFLAETMQKRFDKPTFVLPNMLDPDLWRNGEVKRNLPEDKVLIWLSGSDTHVGDWKVLEGVFPALLKKHPNAVVVICGYHPEYLQGIDGVVYQEGVHYNFYAQMVRQSDIVLAPVDPLDLFNMGKSPIKATEGQGAVRKVQNQFCGAAVVATDNPVYRLTIRNGHDGLLVEHTSQAWFDALDKLITDKALRMKLQVNAYNTVWKKGNWDISRNWTRWADAYRKIGNIKRKQVAPEGAKV